MPALCRAGRVPGIESERLRDVRVDPRIGPGPILVNAVIEVRRLGVRPFEIVWGVGDVRVGDRLRLTRLASAQYVPAGIELGLDGFEPLVPTSVFTRSVQQLLLLSD